MADTHNNNEHLVEDLTLLLIQLTSWDEGRGAGDPILRAWKGYDFDVLDALEEEGYIVSGRRAKSLQLTEKGQAHAAELHDRLQERVRWCRPPT